MTQLTFWSQVPPASHSASRENMVDSMTRVVNWRWSIVAWLIDSVRAGWSGRMSPASYLRIRAKLSRTFCLDSLDGASKRPAAAGKIQEYARQPPLLVPTGWHGECWTLNTCEWNHTLVPSHSDAGVCFLSDILETGDLPPAYFLSPKACVGILRRAAQRKKKLPDHLHQALCHVAQR